MKNAAVCAVSMAERVCGDLALVLGTVYTPPFYKLYIVPREGEAVYSCFVLEFYYLCVWYAFDMKHGFRMHVSFLYGFFNAVLAHQVHNR